MNVRLDTFFFFFFLRRMFDWIHNAKYLVPKNKIKNLASPLVVCHVSNNIFFLHV